MSEFLNKAWLVGFGIGLLLVGAWIIYLGSAISSLGLIFLGILAIIGGLIALWPKRKK